MTSRLCAVASLLTILTVASQSLATAQQAPGNLLPIIPASTIPSAQVRPRRNPSVSAPSLRLNGPNPPALARPIVVADLVEQLRVAHTGQRQNIIQQLSYTQQPVVPALVKALDDPDPLVKSGVAEVLGNRIEDAVPAIPGLIAMMSDLRRAIVPTSSVFLSPPILPISLYSTERRSPPTPPQNPENLLRITAIVALGKIGLPARTAATPPLTQALQDPDPWVRLSATWALAEIGASVSLLPHWLEALQSPDPELRQSAAEVFLDSRSLLRKAFGSEADDNTTAPLVIALNDENFTVRNAAAQALELQGPRALSGLIQALKAPEPGVRLKAAELVGNLAGAAQSAVPVLLPLLVDMGRYVPPSTNQYDTFPILSAPLAFSGNYPYPAPPDNPEQLVRVNAAIALGRVGDRRAIPALTAALQDDSPWMQLATGWALLRLGENRGLPVVGRLVQHSNPSVQRAALDQLKAYGSPAAPYLLPYYKAQLESTDDNQRNDAIIQVGHLGTAALNLVPRLRIFLTSNQKHSSGYAATVLGQIAQDTAIAWSNGSLPANQHRQAIAEFTKVLNLMQAPNARFNREPVNRVRSALVMLQRS
ncbi:MAG: HEAT repeat domain-containing protein [Scytolyngbya sp. HA4215-MV1]|jgi:HEAT repeat protein|nr:HEAT repeat domain-containing protein [Scytolyngbya sp. HA4215-MV1]